MKKSLFVDIIAYFFILLFLYTGVAKLMEIPDFKQQLMSSPLLSPLATIITWTLPLGEILLSIALFVPAFRLKALYVTLALMSLFTAYVVGILVMDSHLACSCGGIVEELSPQQHVVFNIASIFLSGLAITMGRKQASPGRIRLLPMTTIFVLFLLIGWTLFSAFTAPPTMKTGMEGRLLPSFELLLQDSVTHFNTDRISTGKPFIVIGFDPFCTHCQAETNDIIKNIDKFKNVSIYYVTPNPFWQMKAFYQHFSLNRYPNITIGTDYRNAFFQHFNVRIVPYTAIFDSQKRLKQVYASQPDAKSLAKALKE